MNQHAASLAVAVGGYVIGFYMLMSSLIETRRKLFHLLWGTGLVLISSVNLYAGLA